jgi:hypothetical protein
MEVAGYRSGDHLCVPSCKHFFDVFKFFYIQLLDYFDGLSSIMKD